jgi:hypothetical protein
MLNLQTAGGDGASLTIPIRKRFKLFKFVSVLFHSPDGRVADVRLAIMTRRRWETKWAAARPDMRAVHAGPLVVGVGFRL